MTTKIEEGTRYALLVYDIPSDSKLRNPSDLIRRWGARINLSCWVLPLKCLVHLPLKEWEEAGATVEIVEFDEHEREKVIALARRAISRDLDSMLAYLGRTVAEVRKRFEFVGGLATGSDERDEAFQRAKQYGYAALYRAKGSADAAEEAALSFQLTGDLAGLVAGLRQAIKAHAATFYALEQRAQSGAQLKLNGVAS